MGPHVLTAVAMMVAKQELATQQRVDARQLYESYLCDEEVGAEYAPQLAAAAELLGISGEQLVVDAAVADCMRKFEKRRYAAGVRALRVAKRCSEIETKFNARHSIMGDEDAARLRNFGVALGEEELRLNAYRALLAHDVADLAKSSAFFCSQPKRLEIPLPAMEDLEPCDARTFDAGSDRSLDGDWKPLHSARWWEQAFVDYRAAEPQHP